MADSHFFQQFPKTSGGRPKLQTETQAHKSCTQDCTAHPESRGQHIIQKRLGWRCLTTQIVLTY